MADSSTELRKRQMPDGCKKAVTFITTTHGRVALESDNWQAVADIVQVCEAHYVESQIQNIRGTQKYFTLVPPRRQ